jgi:hypothetical protein
VIVPIPRGQLEGNRAAESARIRDELVARGMRVHIDDRESQTPGWKFNEWGAARCAAANGDRPQGSREVASRPCTAGHAAEVARADGRADRRGGADARRNPASALRSGHRVSERSHAETDSYEEFKQIMDGRPGFVVSPWCGSATCEADIKAETQATIPEHSVLERASDWKGLHQMRRRGRRCTPGSRSVLTYEITPAAPADRRHPSAQAAARVRRSIVTTIQVGRSLNSDKSVGAHTTQFKPNDTIYVAVLTDATGTGKITARWTYGGRPVSEGKQGRLVPRRSGHRVSHREPRVVFPPVITRCRSCWTISRWGERDFRVVR